MDPAALGKHYQALVGLPASLGGVILLMGTFLAAGPVRGDEIGQLATRMAEISVPTGCRRWFDAASGHGVGASYTDECHWYEGGTEETGRFWSVTIGEISMDITSSARRKLKKSGKEEQIEFLEDDHERVTMEMWESDEQIGTPPPGFPTPRPFRVPRADLPVGTQSCFITDRFVRGTDADGNELKGDQPGYFEREIDCFSYDADNSEAFRIWASIWVELSPEEAAEVRTEVIESSGPIFSTLRVKQ